RLPDRRPQLRCRVEHALAGRAHGKHDHDARPGVRPDRDAHRIQGQATLARADGAADHHAAVRDRPRAHPDLRPLRPRQPPDGMGVRGPPPRPDLGPPGLLNQLMEWALEVPPSRWIYGLPGVWLAETFAFTPVAFLVLIGVVE